MGIGVDDGHIVLLKGARCGKSQMLRILSILYSLNDLENAKTVPKWARLKKPNSGLRKKTLLLFLYYKTNNYRNLLILLIKQKTGRGKADYRVLG
jgi:hypothetical protein